MKRSTPKPISKQEAPKKHKVDNNLDLAPAFDPNPSVVPFGLGLLRTLAAKDPGTIVVSPFSIDAAFRLLAPGVNEKMYAELQKFFSWPSNEQTLFSEWQTTSKKLFAADETIQITIANSVWLRNALPSYVKAVKEELSASVFPIESPKVINKWVEDQTKGLITEVIDHTGGLMALLINVLYFKGSWTHTFDKNLTHKANFSGSKNKTKVDMMYRDAEDWDYYEGPDYKLVDLPYGPKETYIATVVLPNKDVNDFLLEEKLEELPEERTCNSDGELYLPRFKVEFSANLVGPLQAHGISGIFQGPLEKMTNDPQAQVSEVIHKVVVIVNEEGTEAAAVTAICVKESYVLGKKKFRMVCDRPFLFLIREKTSKAILFLGKIDLTEE